MDVSIDPTVAWGGRLLRRTAAALGVGVLAASVLASIPAAATAWDQSSAEGTLWQLLNGARANNGVAPLQPHDTLIGLARWRSQDMVERGYFSHDVAGTGCQVYCWYDSNGVSYVYGGENIGWNAGWSDADSPVRVHEGFMSSPGHRRNALDPGFTHGGVGAFGHDGTSSLNGSSVENIRMYTQLFLQAPAAAPPPPPPAPVVEPAPVAPPPPPAPAAPVVPVTPAPVASIAPTPTPEPVEAPEKDSAGGEGLAKEVEPDPLAVLTDPRMALEAAPADVRTSDELPPTPEPSHGRNTLRVRTPAPAGLLRFT